MLQLTPEQLAHHRARQKEFARRAPTDAEFEARYDPDASRQRQLIAAIKDLTAAIYAISPDFQPPPDRPRYQSRPAPAIRPLSGPIELQ